MSKDDQMPRLVVVERDVARRETLRLVLSQAGYEVSDGGNGQATSPASIDLLIVGNSDLALLDELPRSDGALSVPVLSLIDPGNCDAILKCLAAGVMAVF